MKKAILAGMLTGALAGHACAASPDRSLPLSHYDREVEQEVELYVRTVGEEVTVGEVAGLYCDNEGRGYRQELASAGYPRERCISTANAALQRLVERTNEFNRETDAYSQRQAERRAEEQRRAEERQQQAEERARAQQEARSRSPLAADQVTDIAEMMFDAYRFGEVNEMYRAERQCWDDVPEGGEHRNGVLEACAIAGLTGMVIEAGYAREQGRTPHINYNADVATARIKERLAEHGVENPDDRLREAYNTNLGVILAGLAGAGM